MNLKLTLIFWKTLPDKANQSINSNPPAHTDLNRRRIWVTEFPVTQTELVIELAGRECLEDRHLELAEHRTTEDLEQQKMVGLFLTRCVNIYAVYVLY